MQKCRLLLLQLILGKYLKNFVCNIGALPVRVYWSQISNIVYGARDLERGCINLKTKLHPKTIIKGGVMETEAAELLKRFFIERRNLN